MIISTKVAPKLQINKGLIFLSFPHAKRHQIPCRSRNRPLQKQHFPFHHPKIVSENLLEKKNGPFRQVADPVHPTRLPEPTNPATTTASATSTHQTPPHCPLLRTPCSRKLYQSSHQDFMYHILVSSFICWHCVVHFMA